MKNYRLLDACENCKHADYVHAQDSLGHGEYSWCSYGLNHNTTYADPYSHKIEPHGKCDNWEGE